MKMPDGTVLPSAFRAGTISAGHGFDSVKKSTNLKIGTIVAVRTVDASEGLQKSALNSSEGMEGTPYETTYDVRVDDHNARPFIFVGCRALKPFMGVNNYFDIIHEAADMSATYIEDGPTGIFASAAESLVGSRCVIMCIEGEPTSPVIMGFLQHPARPSKLTKDLGLHMEFEFQGIHVTIDKDGAFKLEGNTPWIDPIAPPIGPVLDSLVRSNPLAGPFTIELDKDLVFSIYDNMGQTIKIDRSSTTIDITNGTESITMIGSLIPKQGEMLINVGGAFTVATTDTVMGADKSFAINTLIFDIAADTQLAIKTGNFDLKCDLGFAVESMSAAFKVKTAFAAEALTFSFKGASGELLALIYELVDSMGKITAASPVGPCAPLMAAPQWAPILAALVKLKAMTG